MEEVAFEPDFENRQLMKTYTHAHGIAGKKYTYGIIILAASIKTFFPVIFFIL